MKTSYTPVPVRGILFDLDGTLLDTAPDLANALNALLLKHNKPTLEYPLIRNHVSQGSAALTMLGFPEISPKTEEFEQLRKELLDLYAASITSISAF